MMAKAYHKAEAAEVCRLANVVEHSRAVNVRLDAVTGPREHRGVEFCTGVGAVRIHHKVVRPTKHGLVYARSSTRLTDDEY